MSSYLFTLSESVELIFILFSLFNGQVKNVDSAQVSVPGQIKK